MLVVQEHCGEISDGAEEDMEEVTQATRVERMKRLVVQRRGGWDLCPGGCMPLHAALRARCAVRLGWKERSATSLPSALVMVRETTPSWISKTMSLVSQLAWLGTSRDFYRRETRSPQMNQTIVCMGGCGDGAAVVGEY